MHRDTPQEGSITVHVPLQDMSESNAPMGFCPGTHNLTKEETRKMWLKAGFVFGKKLDDAVFDEFCPHGPLWGQPMEVGDIAIYDSRSYHWSDAHENDPNQRLALYYVYKSPTHPGIHPEEGMTAHVRGQRKAFR